MQREKKEKREAKRQRQGVPKLTPETGKEKESAQADLSTGERRGRVQERAHRASMIAAGSAGARWESKRRGGEAQPKGGGGDDKSSGGEATATVQVARNARNASRPHAAAQQHRRSMRESPGAAAEVEDGWLARRGEAAAAGGGGVVGWMATARNVWAAGRGIYRGQSPAWPAMAAAAALVAIGGCNEPRRGGARRWAAWRGARAPQASNGSWSGALAVPVPLLSQGRRRSELFCSDATPRNSFFFFICLEGKIGQCFWSCHSPL